jgi:hypothetical protein
LQRAAAHAVPISSSGRSMSQQSRLGEGGGGDVPLRRRLDVSLQYAMAPATASSLSRVVPSTTRAPRLSAVSGFAFDRLFLLRSHLPSGLSSSAPAARCSFLASLRRHRLTASPFGAASAPSCLSGESPLFGEPQRVPSNEEEEDDLIVIEEAEGEDPRLAPAFTPPTLNAGDEELSLSTVDSLAVAVTAVVAIVAHTAHGNSHAAAS